jgi:hypothetical protein
VLCTPKQSPHMFKFRHTLYLLCLLQWNRFQVLNVSCCKLLRHCYRNTIVAGRNKNIASRCASKSKLFNTNSQSTFVIMCIIRPGRKCLLSHHGFQLFWLPDDAQLCSAQLITAYSNTHTHTHTTQNLFSREPLIALTAYLNLWLRSMNFMRVIPKNQVPTSQ